MAGPLHYPPLALLDETEAAAVLGTDTVTLARWRSEGRGPVSRVHGGVRLYLRHDVVAYRDDAARWTGAAA